MDGKTKETETRAAQHAPPVSDSDHERANDWIERSRDLLHMERSDAIHNTLVHVLAAVRAETRERDAQTLRQIKEWASDGFLHDHIAAEGHECRACWIVRACERAQRDEP